MTFKEAKSKADRIGGVVLWWWSYWVESAKEYNNSHGTPKYVSKKAEKFFKDRWLKEKSKQKTT